MYTTTGYFSLVSVHHVRRSWAYEKIWTDGQTYWHCIFNCELFCWYSCVYELTL